MSQFRPAKKRIEVSTGESVRIIRELQGFSQNQLAELSGIQGARSRALRCHPAVLVFPGWEHAIDTAA